MNNFQHDLISLLVNQKKYDAITEFCHSAYPDEKDVVVSEYCGADIRLFTGSDGSINILCPKEMSTIQESAVTKAIENGTIFDDVETVDNTAKYLELTSLPYNAIINSGREIPKHMHVAIGGVIGNMNDEGRCEVDDASLRNGYQCMRDMMNADTSDGQSVNKIVDNYLGNPDHMSLHKKLRYDIGNLHDEIESIKDINPEDCITDEDCCESFDEYDMDEIETESYMYDEYYDDLIIQEGKTPNYVRNLKHLDYDPKTETILSNIPLPGGKPGERVRVKMIIDDKVSKESGSCVTFDKDSKGNIISGSEVLHIPRRILKSKGFNAMSTVGHELGHVMYQYYPNSSYVTQVSKIANKHIQENEDKLLEENDHERDLEEFGAGGFSTFGRKKSKGKRKVGFSGVSKQSLMKSLSIMKKYSDGYTKNKKFANQEIKKLNRIIKNAESKRQKLDPITLKQIDETYQELLTNLRSLKTTQNMLEREIEKISEDTYDISLPKEELFKRIDDMYHQIAPITKELENIELEITKTKQELKEYDVKHPTVNVIEKAKRDIEWIKDVLKRDEYSAKMRADFIRKYIKEYSTDIPENTDVYQEGFLSKKPKKLKPIPRDIVPYITVEMNAIRDSNDQAMLSGYTCSKLELVDFYLNVIDTNDERYIVPHARQYLVQLQNDLNRLLTQILRIKPINKSDRVWQVNVNYPENWRG